MPDKDPPDQALAPTIATPPAEAPTAAITGPIHESNNQLAAEPPPVGLAFDERYHGGDLLGAGGMGEVRQFEDTVIGRSVAVKFLRDQLSGGDEARARFIREARVQGKLQHPAVVPVYDLASTESGTTFFTMKRLGGRTLADILERVRRGDPEENGDVHQLLTAFADVCLAVDYAHNRGVIHRDLKPANIMLGDFGEVYVLDWGLARLADTEVTTAVTHKHGADSDPSSARIAEAIGVTSSQTVMGTVGYMAPEQLRGEPLDARADVYALGSILFEILSLEPLHHATSNEQRVASTLDGAGQRIRDRARVHTLAPELETLCLDATALERDQRIPGARALYDRLEGYLAGDRDHARRLALAAELAAEAQAEADTALRDSDVAARRRAMAAASRAIALDPDQPGAPATLMRLLMSPPTEMPPEVREALGVSRRRKARTHARLAVFGYLSWLIALPLFVWMGVTDWFLGGAMILAVLTCVGVELICYRGGVVGGPLLFLGVLANALVLFLLTRLFGPLMLTPVLALATSMSFSLYNHRLATIGAPVTATLAIVAAVIGEAAGWLSPSYRFADGQLLVSSAVLELRPLATLATLTLLLSAAIFVSSWIVGSVRRNLDRIETEAQVLLWQYQQISTPPPAVLETP